MMQVPLLWGHAPMAQSVLVGLTFSVSPWCAGTQLNLLTILFAVFQLWVARSGNIGNWP